MKLLKKFFKKSIKGQLLFYLCEMYQIHTVFFGVDCPFHGSSLAIVDDDLVVLGAGDEAGPVVAEAEVVDRVLVVPKHLSHPHRADDIVHQLHSVSLLSS